MDTNIKIVLSDGNVLDAVGISYIHVDAFNKDYIFYSLNELANGNMDKIYIAEANTNGTTPGPLSDDEWNSIKQIMLNISHNEPVSGISYKPLNGLNFNIGEAKKLAIKGDKKQAFIDAQNKAVAPTTAIDEPAFVSDQAANGSPFFDTSVQANETPQVQETVVPSAFAMQPPIEQEIPVESLESDTSAQIDTSVQQPVEPVAIQPEIQPAVQTPTAEVKNAINDAVVPSAIDSIPAIEENTSLNNVVSNSSIEELEAAIIDLQNGINKINSYIQTLKNKNTVVVNTTQVQTVSTGQTPVATEVMNIANQPEIVTDTLVEESNLTPVAPDTIATPIAPTIPEAVIEPVVPTNNSVISTIDTSIDTSTSGMLDTSVNTNVDESVVPTAISPTVGNTVEEGEPAFTIDQTNIVQPQTLVLDGTAIPTPNSAEDINSTSVEMNIPAAPVISDNAPQIPISPLEQSGIPVAPTIAAAPVQSNVVVQTPTNVQPAAAPAAAEQNVQSVQEIPVAPVQQVPIVDLSSINTQVTLPTDMTSNPAPNNGQQGVFGPASLDAESEQ
jgi:hypothetical protein